MNYVLAAANKMEDFRVSITELDTMQDIQEDEMDFEFTDEEDKKIEEGKANSQFNKMFLNTVTEPTPVDAQKEEKKRLRREALRQMNGRTRFADDLVQVKVFEIVDGEDMECRHTQASTRAVSMQPRKSIESFMKILKQLRDQGDYQTSLIQAQKDRYENFLQFGRIQLEDALRTGYALHQVQPNFDQYNADCEAQYIPAMEDINKSLKETAKEFSRIHKRVLKMNELRKYLYASPQLYSA